MYAAVTFFGGSSDDDPSRDDGDMWLGYARVTIPTAAAYTTKYYLASLTGASGRVPQGTDLDWHRALFYGDTPFISSETGNIVRNVGMNDWEFIQNLAKVSGVEHHSWPTNQTHEERAELLEKLVENPHATIKMEQVQIDTLHKEAINRMLSQAKFYESLLKKEYNQINLRLFVGCINYPIIGVSTQTLPNVQPFKEQYERMMRLSQS